MNRPRNVEVRVYPDLESPSRGAAEETIRLARIATAERGHGSSRRTGRLVDRSRCKRRNLR